MSNITEPGYLSVAEVADVSGLLIPTIRRYVRDGKLPAVQAGKGHRVLIPKDALDSLLTQKSTRTSPPTVGTGNPRRSTPQWGS